MRRTRGGSVLQQPKRQKEPARKVRDAADDQHDRAAEMLIGDRRERAGTELRVG
jgi:hypothetical protein